MLVLLNEVCRRYSFGCVPQYRFKICFSKLDRFMPRYASASTKLSLDILSTEVCCWRLIRVSEALTSTKSAYLFHSRKVLSDVSVRIIFTNFIKTARMITLTLCNFNFILYESGNEGTN